MGNNNDVFIVEVENKTSSDEKFCLANLNPNLVISTKGKSSKRYEKLKIASLCVSNLQQTISNPSYGLVHSDGIDIQYQKFIISKNSKLIICCIPSDVDKGQLKLLNKKYFKEQLQ